AWLRTTVAVPRLSLRYSTPAAPFPALWAGVCSQPSDELGDLSHAQPRALGEPGDLDTADGGLVEPALVSGCAIGGHHAVLLIEANCGGGHTAVSGDLTDRQHSVDDRIRGDHGATVVRALDFNQCSTLNVVCVNTAPHEGETMAPLFL